MRLLCSTQRELVFALLRVRVARTKDADMFVLSYGYYGRLFLLESLHSAVVTACVDTYSAKLASSVSVLQSS